MFNFIILMLFLMLLVGALVVGVVVIAFMIDMLDRDDRKEAINSIKKYTLLHYNDLFKCNKCSMYFREYQSQLYKTSKNIKEKKSKYCPHCKTENQSNYFSEFTNIKKYPEYLDTHLSCLKLKGYKEKIQMKKSIKLYKERNIIDKQQKEFERVQKQTQDDPLKWLKNIQGDDKL